MFIVGRRDAVMGAAGGGRAPLLLAATASRACPRHAGYSRHAGHVGLPLEGLAIVLGIDLLDMGRTATNFTRRLAAAVARWEGDLDDEQMRAFGRAREAA
jgi:hypothetical protein